MMLVIEKLCEVVLISPQEKMILITYNLFGNKY